MGHNSRNSDLKVVSSRPFPNQQATEPFPLFSPKGCLSLTQELASPRQAIGSRLPTYSSFR